MVFRAVKISVFLNLFFPEDIVEIDVYIYIKLLHTINNLFTINTSKFDFSRIL